MFGVCCETNTRMIELNLELWSPTTVFLERCDRFSKDRSSLIVIWTRPLKSERARAGECDRASGDSNANDSDSMQMIQSDSKRFRAIQSEWSNVHFAVYPQLFSTLNTLIRQPAVCLTPFEQLRSPNQRAYRQIAIRQTKCESEVR